MKLLRMRLANWLTKGGYLAACKAATHWEDRYQDMSAKVGAVEHLLDATEQHLSSAERALIEKDERINELASANTRMSEGLDAIIRAGEGKIEGRKCNGSLRRVVRMAEAALFPTGVPKEMVKAREDFTLHWPINEPHDGAIKLASKVRGFPCEFVKREGYIVTYRRAEPQREMGL